MDAKSRAGSPPRFRAIQDVSKSTEANPEHRQFQSTEQQSQNRDAAGQFNDPHSTSNGNASE
jgi:hypothetical protein